MLLQTAMMAVASASCLACANTGMVWYHGVVVQGAETGFAFGGEAGTELAQPLEGVIVTLHVYDATGKLPPCGGTPFQDLERYERKYVVAGRSGPIARTDPNGRFAVLSDSSNLFGATPLVLCAERPGYESFAYWIDASSAREPRHAEKVMTIKLRPEGSRK